MNANILNQMSALEAADEIASGRVNSETLTENCLSQISEIDSGIKAWAFVDPDLALSQAREADIMRQNGYSLGLLHGVPVGVKDIVDVAGMPCENGTVLDAGRVPPGDSAIATLLRSAGAVLLGKTVTTELAFYHPGKTHNPHDRSRTPGGSSSGSAAAVASQMVPLAIGSQTKGSIIRPASFCGVIGYKPSFGLIDRTGVLRLSPSLDTIGVFAQMIEDVALLGDSLIRSYPPGETHYRRAPLRLLQTCRSDTPVRPNIALIKSPMWDRTDTDTRQGFMELAESLGSTCDEVELPPVFDQAYEWHQTIMAAEMARYLQPYERRGRDQLSEEMIEIIDDGRAVDALAYQDALEGREVLRAGLDAIFDRFDAIITPAAAGEAPQGLEWTGDPSFAALWTYCGVPSLSLPLLKGSNGLPIGVQLLGRFMDDGRLLRTARWLVREITSPPDDQSPIEK